MDMHTPLPPPSVMIINSEEGSSSSSRVCVARRNRLSTYEVKAVSHQNDSVPGGDASPDEAQQDQGTFWAS